MKKKCVTVNVKTESIRKLALNESVGIILLIADITEKIQCLSSLVL